MMSRGVNHGDITKILNIFGEFNTNEDGKLSS